MKSFSINLWITGMFIISLALLNACGNKSPSDVDPNFIPDTAYSPQHARLFKVGTRDGHRAVIVLNPWDTNQVWGRYILASRKENYKVPKGYTLVYQPIRTLATTSSTLFSSLQSLGCMQRLTGVSDSAFIINPTVKKRIKKGLIVEIGQGDRIFNEQLIACDPDAAFFSLFPGTDFERFRSVGIVALPLADYLESTPLGRAEWIRFIGIFLGKEHEADSIFKEIKTNYLRMKELALSINDKPSIIDGMLQGDTWYVSASQSYMAELYRDAGLNYVFSDKPGPGSIPVSFEEIVSRSSKAEYWRLLLANKNLNNRSDLLNLDPRYKLLPVFTNSKILYCNVSEVPLYEVGNARPDLVLSDLIHLTHPGLDSDYQPYFYHLLP
ncbi:MAG: ABC transporter substrate-binding protein [Bacteroidales bacterium]